MFYSDYDGNGNENGNGYKKERKKLFAEPCKRIKFSSVLQISPQLIQCQQDAILKMLKISKDYLNPSQLGFITDTYEFLNEVKKVMLKRKKVTMSNMDYHSPKNECT